MRFLVDANMPRSALALLKYHGHEARHVRDIGLGSAPDIRIAAHARVERAAMITRDFDFADIRHHPPAEYEGILVLHLPEDATAPFIIKLLDKFLKQSELVAQQFPAIWSSLIGGAFGFARL